MSLIQTVKDIKLQIYNSIKIQMSKISTLVCVILIYSSVNSKHVLQSDLNQITQESLTKDPYIEVEGTSKHFNIQQYDLTHLKFSWTGRNKRKTYEHFLHRYKKIVNCLIRNQIIPHETAMIQSNIQMNFISKKRVWQFSRIFVIYSDSKQLDKVLHYLQPFKLTRLKQRMLMGYLNEKLISIKAFNSAKSKLQKFLKKRVNSKLQIIYVVDIEIQGKRFINEQDIEAQIKNQNNYSKSQNEVYVTKNEPKSRERKQYTDKELIDQDVTMKVLFKLGQNRQEDSVADDLQDDENNKSDDSGDGNDLEDSQIQISPDGEVEEEEL